MAVFRIERTRDYTVMSNHHLRNANLSLKAKGLLSMMLSLPEDWNYTTRGLAKRIYARHYLGMKVNEITEVEGVDSSRVRDSIRRGLKLLVKYF